MNVPRAIRVAPFRPIATGLSHGTRIRGVETRPAGLVSGGFKMSLLRLAHVPSPIVEPSVSVLDAVDVMARNRVGAVAVVEHGVLRGIFTERDVMLRVVEEERNPRTTLVREVMTAQVKTLTDDSTPDQAIELMLVGHLRHVPVLDPSGHVLGLLSIRSLLEDKVYDLSREVHALEQYMANDGPGG
jgi:CBS domain-containing protein